MESVAPSGDWRVAWAYRFGLFGLCALLAAPVLIRPTGDWESTYLSAAWNLRTGADVLTMTNGYVYPPFGALFAVPFTFLDRAPGLVAWVLLNVGAAGVVFIGAWRLTGGLRVPGATGTSRVDHAAFWLAGLCAVGFFLDIAANWQTDLVITAILIGGAILLVRGYSLSAGLAFGVAAAFKLTPLLLAPYLLWKRRFLAAVAVPVVALGLNLLPDAIYPPADGKPRLVVWKDRFLAPMAAKDRDPGLWASSVAYNHSLAGVNLRWLVYDRATSVEGWLTATPKANRPTATDLKRLNLGITGVLGLIALVAVWRRPGAIAAGPVSATELGIVFTLMLLLSPMSSKPHFVLLLLPQLALTRLAWQHRDRVLMVLVALAAIGGLGTGKDVVGRKAYEFLLWNGVIFWTTVALFLGCCHARFWYGTSRREVVETLPLPDAPDANPVRLAA